MLTRSGGFLLTNALVFDGTGAAPVAGDVSVSDGHVLAMGAGLTPLAGQEVIDCRGLWLMPGLLDIHTHLDLEVELAPELPEAVRHGTTTVVMSNCSLGVAFGNQRRGGADPIVDCFARVENVPRNVLRKVGDAVTWSDSGDYLDHFDQLKLGPNVVAMIPHSMLRIEVMGLQESITRQPTPEELQRMESLVEKGMREGYVGLSTDALPFHYLANRPNTQKQIPTQFASYEEIRRLTDVVRRWGRVWQATPWKESVKTTARNFLLSSGRFFGKPLKLTVVAAIEFNTNPKLAKMALLLSRIVNSRLVNGRLRFQVLPAPFKLWSDGMITPLAEEIPELRRLIECETPEERLRILESPDYVQAFKRMWSHGKRGFNRANLQRLLRREKNVLSRRLDEMFVDGCPLSAWNGESLDAPYQRLRRWQASGGREGAASPEEVAFWRTCPNPMNDDAEFFLHLLRQWDTRLRWWTVTANRDPATVRKLFFHPQTLPGFNDSGAHLTNMAFFDCNLRGLQLAQSEGIGQVARSIHRMTQVPAEFFSIDAGVLKVGARADICVVDPAALEGWDPEATIEYVHRDLFECRQLVNRPPDVVRHVLVAGKLAWSHGSYTAAFGRERFGQLLRAGQTAAAPRELAAAA